MNRLIIRMQRNGNAIEINDTLYFDIPDSLQVARCMRGRTVGGVPDYDDTTHRQLTAPDATMPTMRRAPWCRLEPGGMSRASTCCRDGPVRVSRSRRCAPAARSRGRRRSST